MAEPGRWPGLSSTAGSHLVSWQFSGSNIITFDKRNKQKVDCSRKEVRRLGCCCFLHLCGLCPAHTLQLPSERATVQGHGCKWHPCHYPGTGELGSCLAKKRCFPAIQSQLLLMAGWRKPGEPVSSSALETQGSEL